MEFWKTLWTSVWLAGMLVFTGLSVAIIVHGARDVLELLRALVVQHSRQEDDRR